MGFKRADDEPEETRSRREAFWKVRARSRGLVINSAEPVCGLLVGHVLASARRLLHSDNECGRERETDREVSGRNRVA